MKKIGAMLVLGITCAQSFASSVEEVNYEDHLVNIYKYIIEHKNDVIPYRIDFNSGGKIVKDGTGNHVNEQNLNLVKEIKKATEKHRLILKSIAYQPEWENKGKCNDDTCDAQIRVTWADKENNIIVKALYNLNTDKEASTLSLKKDDYNDAPSRLDFSLRHSFYADKEQIDNIKVMYRNNKKSAYQYFEIDKMDMKYQNLKKGPIYGFKELADKHCVACHALAPDVKNKLQDGAFFPRFQYNNPLAKELMKQISYPSLVLNSKPIIKSKEDAKKLGLPDLNGDFIYQTIDVTKDWKMKNATLNKGNEKSNDFKTLFMNVDILQNNAIAANKSICVNINFEVTQKTNSYICADMVTRKVLSKLEKYNNGIQKNNISSY